LDLANVSKGGYPLIGPATTREVDGVGRGVGRDEAGGDASLQQFGLDCVFIFLPLGRIARIVPAQVRQLEGHVSSRVQIEIKGPLFLGLLPPNSWPGGGRDARGFTCVRVSFPSFGGWL